MHIEDERLYLLLDRYLAGEASARDAETVRAWLADDPEHRHLLEDLRLIKRVAAERAPESSADAAWAKAVEALEVAPESRVSQPPLEVAPQPRVSRRPLVAALAAAAVVIALIGGGAVLRRPQQWSEYTTAAAHRAVIRLRDGTQVTLAPKSRVRYAADYGKAHRDVYLDGEAYFQFAPDARRSDVVLTLEGWYNVEIRLADRALAMRQLTATFTNEPIDLVLKRIALTLGLRVERADGSGFVLRKSR